MPRVIQFPPAEDARDAQAWAAFAAEDAAVRVPAALESRVMRAAQRALADHRRAEIERRRRMWHAVGAAVAATILAAAAWSLAPSTLTPTPHATAAAAPAAVPDVRPAAPAARSVGGRVPMTNVEAGRVLGPLPRQTLAARPLFEASEGIVRAPAAPHARPFGDAPMGHATSGAQFASTEAAAPQPAAAPVLVDASPRAVHGKLDPGAEKPDPADAGFRLELVNPAPPPAPEPPPKK